MSPTIASPLHILHLSQPDTPQIALLKDTETHDISTAYYSASIPIWRDTLPSTPATISAWSEEWSAPEAGEVVQAVGAWVVSFRKARTRDEVCGLRDVLSCISAAIERHTTGDGLRYVIDEKPLMLAVGMQQVGIAPSLEMGGDEWEDLCRDSGGWEWIDGTVEEEKVNGSSESGNEKSSNNNIKAKEEEWGNDINEYREKVGMARLKEALEAHEWEGRGGDDFEGLDDLGFGDDDDDASLGFGEEAMEAQMEIWGMQSDVRKDKGRREEDENNDTEHGTDQVGDRDVQELETMMLKMQAVRDMGADMAEGERKKFAAKAVREVLKKM